jgi:hypothetical protein
LFSPQPPNLETLRFLTFILKCPVLFVFNHPDGNIVIVFMKNFKV